LNGCSTKTHGADGIIIDELSKASGKQTNGLNTKRRGDCFKWRVGMTATPVSQNFERIFDMVKRVDKGKAFGTNKNDYLNKYFYSDYMGYNWTLRAGAEERILARITKLVHMVDDTKEATLPPLVHDIEQRFDMPSGTRAVYNKMKKDMVVGDIEAVNAAVRDGKLRQIASGFAYDEDKNVAKLDSARIDEAVNWWLDHKRPAVIFYEYVAQGERLEAVFAKHLSGSVDDFINGKGTVLVAQISSLSHGVDGLQDVCHDGLFYHPVWSRDQKEQALGRLWRTGQKHPVTMTTLVCNDTLDDVVIARVEGRKEWMDLFTKHMGGK
jgi:superfamily II DNA or RNA helicase